MEQAELSRQELARDDAGDQEARNDKEDIDTNEAARHRIRKGVEQHDQQHSDRAQALDIGPVSI